MKPPVSRLDVHDLRRKLQQADVPVLVDVRETDEWQYCRLEGARHIPLSALESRAGELDPEWDTVVYCHHGVRSLAAARLLQGRGFPRVASLDGGIDAWSAEIDSAVPRY